MADGDIVQSDVTEHEALQAFSAGQDEVLSSLGRFNLAIVGDTGVGKSTLVNAIFGGNRAKTGIGAPITPGAEYYLREDKTLGIWDSQGFEHGTKVSAIKKLKKTLKDNQRDSAERAIHVAWFCWDASGARLTDGHRALIEVFAEAGIPVMAVLTKVQRRPGAFKAEHAEFARWIEEQSLGFADPHVYLTAAEADPDFGLEKYGLEQLLHATIALAPEATRDAAKRAQVIDVKLKRELAWKWISGASTSAAVAAATPIPVASAAVLAPIQLAMFGRISAIYDKSLKEVLGGGTKFQLLLQLTGRAAAQSLVKLIPGAGSVINASVATLWTAAAGEAWRQMCERSGHDAPVARNFREFQALFGPVVEELVKGWLKRGGKPQMPQ